MNDVVENLKLEKDQVEYKLQQYENLLECQKLEIESKSSLLKQFDFVKNLNCTFLFNVSLFN